jgi:DNA-binding MarR family transcriptional regulator
VTTVSPDTPVAQELDAIALEIVDAIGAGDTAALRRTLGELRSMRPGDASGGAAALISTAQWALERLPSPAESELVAEGTQAWRFLSELRHAGRGSGQLQALLGVDQTQVSRTGRRLLDAGLVTRRKLGRTVSWDLTPRGRSALESAAASPRRRALPGPGEPGGDVDWWREVIRNAWRAPGHDSGDPVGDRILDAAEELHMEKGVLETTWQEIAAAAGVPVAEVDARYPTVEDLVPACGGLSLGRIRLPPPEHSAELFEGLDREERLVALVTTLFGLYDGGARSLRTMRRESERLPLVAHARAAFEETRDALIAAALAPEDDGASIALVRSLTELGAWEGFRAGGVPDGEVAALIAAALAARTTA